MESIIIEIKINSFLFKYIFKAYSFSVIWMVIYSLINNDDANEESPIFFFAGIISFSISIVVSIKISMNIYSLFFFIGGMQMLLFPIFKIVVSNNEVPMVTILFFSILEIAISLIIYQLFYKI